MVATFKAARAATFKIHEATLPGRVPALAATVLCGSGGACNARPSLCSRSALGFSGRVASPPADKACDGDSDDGDAPLLLPAELAAALTRPFGPARRCCTASGACLF